MRVPGAQTGREQPMHGTVLSADDMKARRIDAITPEIEGLFTAFRQESALPGGVDPEFTGDDVAECIGGVVPRRHR